MRRPILVKGKFPGHPAGQQVLGHAVFPIALVISKNGIPTDVHLLRPVNKELDPIAVRIAETWRFEPGTKDGQAIDVAARFNLALGEDFRPRADH